MKIYNNEITKKILIGLTTLTLMSSSYSHAYAIKKTDNLAPSYSYQSMVDSGEVTYENFNNHLESISDVAKILEETSTHKYTNRYNPESAKYSIRMKVLNYFANYDYICNTELENKLREEQVIDTYNDMDSFGLVLDLGAANAILADLVTYNFKKFIDIKYDEEFDWCIKSRKTNVQSISNMINPSIFVINQSDKKYLNDNFSILIKLINCCNNNDFENIKNCMAQYFSYQMNDSINVSSGAKWLNNLTNNAMCIRILETYMVQYYDVNVLENLFLTLEDEELRFSEVYEEDCCNEYDVTSLNFDNITDYNLRIMLECDRKLHTNVYTNSNNYLLNSVSMSIENQNSMNIKK